MFLVVVGVAIVLAAIVAFVIYSLVRSHPPRRRSGDKKQATKW